MRSQLKALTDELADPFAKALATFVRETAGATDSTKTLIEKLQSSKALQKASRQHIAQLQKEHRQAKKEGRATERLEFVDIPEPKPTLQNLVRQKGITQKELAKRTGMDAAMVSRVLKDPNRSKLATVKRIAHALGVRLGDLNLDAA
ncbi:MAG: helix-turn-helix transcriptional regulator [Phycisphaerales bacterium]|nr:helix-turn-helix transcriptional regulator [Phycisphaerales bacterium]